MTDHRLGFNEYGILEWVAERPNITAGAPAWNGAAHTRVRDDAYGLNVDNGWVQAEDYAGPHHFEAGTANRFRMRFCVDEYNNKIATVTPTLYVSRNSGAYTRVNASSSYVSATASSQYDDTTDVCSTQLLSDGTVGAFENDGASEETDGATPSHTISKGNWFETEFCVYLIDEVDSSDGDSFNFRLYDGTSPFDTYHFDPYIILDKITTVEGDGTGTGVATATGTADVTHNAVATVKGVATAAGTGSVTVYGAGTATGVAEATGTAHLDILGVATVTGVGTASAVATVKHYAIAIAAGIATVLATPSVTHNAVASATGVATTDAAGFIMAYGASTVTGVGTASGTGFLTVPGVATVTGVATAQGTASVTHNAVSTVTGVATTSAVATLYLPGSEGIATGVATAEGTAVLNTYGIGLAAGIGHASGTATLYLAGSEGIATGVATASGTADVTHNAVSTVTGVATASGTGTLSGFVEGEATVTGVGTASGTAVLHGYGVSTVTGVATASGTGSLSGQVAGDGTATGVATASGTSSVTHNAVSTVVGVATSSGTATIYLPSAEGIATGVATASGTGTLNTYGIGLAAGIGHASGTATLYLAGSGATATGVGSADATGSLQVFGDGSATGVATASATGFLGLLGEATATGIGYAGGDASVQHNAQGTATGVATVVAVGDATGQVPEATATGVATAAGTATVEHNAVGTATGVATASGTLTAGDYSAQATATGRAYAWAGELPGWSYIAYLDDGIWFRLAKYSPLYGIQVLSSVYYEHEPNVYYNIVLEADGNALNAKVWSDAESEPAWMIQETDTEYASGSPGMVALSTTEVLFDVFSTGLGGDPYPLGRLPGTPTWLQPEPPVYLTRADPVLTLEWTQPTMTGDVMGGLVAYELEFRRDGDTAWTNFWRGYDTTYDWDMGRMLAGEYCVRVRAYVGCEYGPWAELCGISFEGKAPVFETPDGYYFGDDNVGQPDHGMWIRLFQASHLDDEFPVNACLVSRELIPAGVGGECLFKKLYLNLTYTTAATVIITPIVDGEVIEEEAKTLYINTVGNRIVDRFEVDLTRGYDDAGVEQFRYGMRGTYFQVRVCVVDTGGTGRVEIDGVALKYTVARETHTWARPFWGELETDVSLASEGGYFFGTATEDVPAALYKHEGESDFGLIARTLIQPRMIAPFGTSEEAWFRSLYLCVTRSNQTAWGLEVVPIIDGVELTAETVTLDAVTQPKTEVFEIPLSRPYELADIERSRYGIRGVWFTYRISTVGRRPAGEITFDGAALEAIPCRETEAGS